MVSQQGLSFGVKTNRTLLGEIEEISSKFLGNVPSSRKILSVSFGNFTTLLSGNVPFPQPDQNVRIRFSLLSAPQVPSGIQSSMDLTMFIQKPFLLSNTFKIGVNENSQYPVHSGSDFMVLPRTKNTSLSRTGFREFHYSLIRDGDLELLQFDDSCHLDCFPLSSLLGLISRKRNLPLVRAEIGRASCRERV